MATMPVRNSKPPSIITKQVNGSIPESMLEPVDSKVGVLWKMASLPARGMRAMRVAIHDEFGVWLDTTGRGRTLYMQYDAFCGPHARYRPCSKAEYDANHALGKELTKFWARGDTTGTAGQRIPGRATVAAELKVTIPESDYWTKINVGTAVKPRYLATAAVPGQSPHGWNCADDLALPDGSDADTNPDGIGDRQDILQWLYGNEMDYGYAHGTTSEIWHVQWFVGDTVPAKVLAYEATLPTRPPIPPPIVTPPPVVVPPTTQPSTPKGTDVRFVMIDIIETGAVLYAFHDEATGAIPWAEWTGSGVLPDGSPNHVVLDRLQGYKDAKVPTISLGVADCKRITLLGDLPTGDREVATGAPFDWTGKFANK